MPDNQFFIALFNGMKVLPNSLLQPVVEAVHRTQEIEKRVGTGFSAVPFICTE